MSDNKSPWGPIITTEEIDEEDPIRKLLSRIEVIKDTEMDFSRNQTIKEFEDEKKEQINVIEKQISDILYRRQLRRMMR